MASNHRKDFPNFDLEMDSGQSGDEYEEYDSRYGDADVEDFIEDSKNSNTTKKTKCDVSLLQTFIQIRHKDCSDVEIETLEPTKLAEILADFFVNHRQKGGKDYQPSSLNNQMASFSRYLVEKQYSENLYESDTFAVSRKALKAKQKDLKAKGKGNKPNKCRALTEEEVDRLFRKKVFSLDTPEALQSLVYFNNCLHFGMRPGKESRELQLGDITLEYAAESKSEYLKLNERVTKTRTGEEPKNVRSVPPKMFSTTGDMDDPRDPVAAYKKFMDRRPSNSLQPESPFYLGIKHSDKENDKVWYRSQAMGKNALASLMSHICQLADMETNQEGGRIRNHSIRKTCVKQLKKKQIPDTDIIQITGHRNLASINNYNELDDQEHRAISHTLSGYKSGIPSEPTPKPVELGQKSGQPVIFGNIYGGNFNVNIHSAPVPDSADDKRGPLVYCEKEEVAVKRRRIVRIISSDSSQD